MFYKIIKISEFIIDETQLKVGSEFIWLWITIEPETKTIVAINISKERNMFVEERFLYGIIKAHGKHPVSTEMDTHMVSSTSLSIFKTTPSHSFLLLRKVLLKELFNT